MQMTKLQVRADLAKLRELEAERAAAQTRLDFYRSKADGLQERIAKGYEGDVGALWDVAQQQNAEAAALRRLDLRLTALEPAALEPAALEWTKLRRSVNRLSLRDLTAALVPALHAHPGRVLVAVDDLTAVTPTLVAF